MQPLAGLRGHLGDVDAPPLRQLHAHALVAQLHVAALHRAGRVRGQQRGRAVDPCTQQAAAAAAAAWRAQAVHTACATRQDPRAHLAARAAQQAGGQLLPQAAQVQVGLAGAGGRTAA